MFDYILSVFIILYNSTGMSHLIKKSLAVSLRTTMYNIRKYYMLLILRYFVRISEQAATFAVYIINPYPTAFPYGNGMVLHFYQQQESSTTKTVHKVINKRLKAYV